MQKRSIVWKGCYNSTTEYMELNQGESIIVRGHITGEDDGMPYYTSYIIHADLQWEVRAVSVIVKSINSIELFFEKKNGKWFNKDGVEMTELKDCIDIDISLTPFTNTLPVRRLRLPPGATQEITVLYFKLPEGEFYPMQQRYTNIDNRFCKYENIDGAYAAMLEMDNEGIVIIYPGRWQRVYPLIIA